jgi:hypothetical protein
MKSGRGRAGPFVPSSHRRDTERRNDGTTPNDMATHDSWLVRSLVPAIGPRNGGTTEQPLGPVNPRPYVRIAPSDNPHVGFQSVASR